MRLLLPIVLMSVSFPVFAVIELTENFTLSGFGSTSWTKSDNATTLMINRNITDESCFDCDTTFGIQLDYYQNSFKTSLQVVKRPQDDWSSPQLEWAYVGYEVSNFDLHLGRLRLPLFLASEYYYVGHAYKSARPPTEVYNSILGITAFNGVSVTWHHELNDEQSLSIMPIIGFRDDATVEFSKETTLKLKTDHLFGFNASLHGYNYKLSLAALKSHFDQTTITEIGNFTHSSQNDDQDILLWSLGAEYELDKFLVTTEAQTNDHSSSLYGTLAYQENKLTPYFTYGILFDEHEHVASNSYLAGFRYDIHFNVSLNAEIQYFDTKSGRGSFLSTPEPNDAILYTTMLSFVF